MHHARRFADSAYWSCREDQAVYWRRNAARELQAARLAHRLVMGWTVPRG
jgi:hypothetical protein